MSSHDDLNTVIKDIIDIGKANFIVVTGGIGDFLAIDYFLK
jgi:hypothetical protein